MSANFDKYPDIIDSRDIVERLGELIYQNQAYIEHEEGSVRLTNEERAEMFILERLVDEINDNAGDTAENGVTLIRDSYFKEYAQELADELGVIPADYSWPTSCIDWEQAARELRMDYSSVDFDGVTYWVR